jgi:hypothetical protein
LIGSILGGVSAGVGIYQAVAGPKKPNLPPSPFNPGQEDQQVHDAEQAQLKRQQEASGLASTVGTPGGQAGSVLNPTTLTQHTLLGG